MNSSLFSDQKRTGELVRVAAPWPDWAFIPEPLQSKRGRFSPRLVPLLLDAVEALGNLNGTGRYLPSTELLLRPLQNREALRSSRLEGTIATPEEFLLFATNPREPKSQDDRANAWREVFNYRTALRTGLDGMNTLPLWLRLIRNMHEALLHGVRGKEGDPGQFRRLQVCIESDRRYIPPPVQYIDTMLNNLEQYMNVPADDLHPLVRCFLVHYQFEAIHPFRDGNGRIGRVLLALMIYKTCNHREPWLYMSPFYERYKDEYKQKLFKVSSEGAWDDWIEFCLRGTIVQANDAIRRCDALIALREEYKHRVKSHSPRTHELIEYLFIEPVVNVPMIAEKIQKAYGTARDDIQILVDAGILKELPDSYPRAHFASEIFSIAYSEPEDLSMETTRAIEPAVEVSVSISSNVQSPPALQSESASST